MKICVIYLDDLIIFSDSFEQHLERLDMVLTRLQQCNLKLSPEKCFVFSSRKGKISWTYCQQYWFTKTDPEKIEKIKNWPTNPDRLQSFVAFAGYYRRFVKYFSKITKPLTDLLPPTISKKNTRTKKTKEWNWDGDCGCTFNKLKEILTSPPILANPVFQQPFELHTDTSGTGLGAMLYQTQNDVKKVIAYASRSLSKSKKKNTRPSKLEFLALKWAVTEKFADYLTNTKFTVYTDNNPLTHIFTSAKLDATGQRWASALGHFDFDLIYRAGVHNKDAYAMSRYPYETMDDDHRIKIEDSTVKTICGSLQLLPDGNVETQTPASIKIMDASEVPGQPLAQIEQREIRKFQRQDFVLGKWIRATRYNKIPKNYDYSKEDQIMKKTFHNLKIIRGILYREIKDGDNIIQQMVLPKVYYTRVLQSLHNEVGHPGRDRTLSLIRERFHWPKITAHIKK